MTMFNEDFCRRLEYAISGALTKSKDVNWRRCWCDGILHSETEARYSPEQILKTKVVVTKVWIDEGRKKKETGGQSLYELLLFFGNSSLRRIETGDRFDDCIPDAEAESWLVLDIENRTMEVKLR